MQGGADWLMVFGGAADASTATQAMVGFLTSRAGARQWAAIGFDLSPNNRATRGYTNAQLIKKALATAAGFTPDIGDTICCGFGSAEWAAIVDVIGGGEIGAALSAAAGVQAEAIGGG